MSFDNISGTVLCSVWMEYVCVGPFACHCATPNHHLSRTLWIFCQEHLPLSQNRHRPPKSLQTKYFLNIFITLIIFLCGPQTSNSNLSPILYKQTNKQTTTTYITHSLISSFWTVLCVWLCIIFGLTYEFTVRSWLAYEMKSSANVQQVYISLYNVSQSQATAHTCE